MTYIELSSLTKSFGINKVVDDFSLSIPEGAFVSLLGPSGCGKTTVLRMLAGLEAPTSGTITIDGKDVTHLKANQRQIGMVFQSYALFPNLTVTQNVAFGLKIAKQPRETIAARVADMLRLIGLSDLGHRYPFQLSGGQQQRVALARALATKPRVLLLDEPLSALDAKIRVSLRSEIRSIQRELGITTIFVTHDQEEALSISDHVVVMNGGKAEQMGSPIEIYNGPKTKFVATFVGTLNLLTGTADDPANGVVHIGGLPVRVSGPIHAAKGEPVALAIRPENIRLSGSEPMDLTATAEILDVAFLGSVIRVKAHIFDRQVEFDVFNQSDFVPPHPGDRIDVGFNGGDLLVLTS